MFNSKSKIFRLILIAGILFLGLSPLFIDSNSELSAYNGQTIEIRGSVVEQPDVRINHVKLVVLAYSPAPGKVLVNVSLYPRYQYGDELLIKCKLQTPEPFKGFAYDKYLAKDKIFSTCGFARIKLFSRGNGDWLLTNILKFKSRIQQLIYENLPEPQASFFSAITLANRKTVPPDVLEKFNLTGTTHLMAISGLHITILVSVLMQLCLVLYIPRKYTFWLVTIFLIFYITMIGFPPSAVRAGIMGWLVLVAMYLGRLNQSTNVLLLAAVLMLAFNNNLLLYDIGFQLSFAAVLGIINFFPWFEKLLQRVPNFIGLRDILSMSFAAQISTAPLVIYYFERLAIIGPLANLLILPVLPYLMIVGFAAIFLSIILPTFSLYFFWPAWFLLTYILKVVNYLSSFDYAAINV